MSEPAPVPKTTPLTVEVTRDQRNIITVIMAVNPEQLMVLWLVASLLIAHWEEAEEAMGEDPKLKIGFAAVSDRSGKRPNVKVSSTITKSFKDEAQCWVEDPNQPELPMDDGEVLMKPGAKSKPVILAIEETSSLPDMEAMCLALPAPGGGVVEGQFEEVQPTPAEPEYIPIDEAAVMFGLSIQYLSACVKDGHVAAATVRGEWVLDLASLRALFNERQEVQP